MKQTINLSLEKPVYQAIKKQVPERKVSSLVNNLLKDYLKKQQLKELTRAYQDFGQNKKIQQELAIWQEAVGDGINDESN